MSIHNAGKPLGTPNSKDPRPAGLRMVNLTSIDKYIKFSPPKPGKYITNNCRCWSCDTVKDFAAEYYGNSSILLDNDSLIHIPKVVK